MTLSLSEANAEARKNRINEGAEKLLGLYFPVLDHGFVSLVDYCGSDASIARAARCSYGAGTRSISDDAKLIRYLIRHRHSSPLEMMDFTFHIKAPIFVIRQWVRHRTASLNEYSGRYSVMPLQFYMPERGIVKYQSKDNKQGRSGEVSKSRYRDFCNFHQSIRDLASAYYEEDINDDISRELARIDLPLSTYTELYWKMDLHNLLHFLKLRCDEHAQYEIRVFANVIAAMVKETNPIAFDAWMDYVYMAKSLSDIEARALFQLTHGDILTRYERAIKEMEISGASKREISEFDEKIKAPQARPEFSLDIESAKTALYFQEEAQKYVPDIE
jgi:thymidylate synthase (FAD)